jgi:hypothetical protein
MDAPRIVWLAAADARGHLMRAHIARALLAARGVSADIVTTSDDGRRFLAALGTPSEVLSSHYGVAFDAWQNMDRRKTEACILRYVLSPARGIRDLRRIGELSRGAAYIVNDFHPLLLLAGASAARTVHVYGETLFQAIAHNFAGRAPDAFDRRFADLTCALRDRAFARIEHSLAAPTHGVARRVDGSLALPPIVALPRRSRAEVRAVLGVGAGQKLAAVYLNPHFRDESLARTIEAELGARGYFVHAVGEGFGARSAFRACDGSFADVVAASQLLVSAPGMASCTQARLFGLPFVALATDQPEQRSNLAALAEGGLAPVAAVDLVDPEVRASLGAAFGAAVDRAAKSATPIPEGHALAAIENVHARWADVLTDLVALAPPIESSRRLSPGARSRSALQPEV